MKLTTGFDFQGYFITEYYDVIFDEMLIGLGFGRSLVSALDNFTSALTGTEATTMIEKLNSAKAALRDRVIRKAAQFGANALIGIDFESSKLGDLIMVSMTATAVRIEKIVSGLPYTEKDEREEQVRQAEKLAQEQKAVFLANREDALKNGTFARDSLLHSLASMDSATDMYAFVQELSEKHPGLFSPDILRELEDSVTLERMYGRRTGVSNFTNKITKYLSTL